MKKIAIVTFIIDAVLGFGRWFIAKRKEKMEIKCPFWEKCGGAIFHDYWAKQIFPYRDPRRDYIGAVCSNESSFSECEHYQIRINPRAVKKENKEG